ncbi:MAG: hypothetical protein AAFV07_19500 [Bacteroidota bacterium]
MSDHPPKPTPSEDEELREIFPLFKKWRHLYTFVLVELGVLIILFYLFSQAFA